MKIKYYFGDCQTVDVESDHLPAQGSVIYFHDYANPRVILTGNLTNKKFKVKASYLKLVLTDTKLIKEFETKSNEAIERFSEISNQIKQDQDGGCITGFNEDRDRFLVARQEGEVVLEPYEE